MILLDKKRLTAIGSKGMTLIEVLLVMGLMSIFLVMLTGIFTAALDVRSQSQSSATVVQDGRFILARLAYDINHATAVTTPGSLGVSGPSLVMTVGGSTYTYALSGTDLKLTDATGTESLNGGDTTVSSLSFIKYGNAGGDETVKIAFTVTSKIIHAGAADSQTFSTTVGLR